MDNLFKYWFRTSVLLVLITTGVLLVIIAALPSVLFAQAYFFAEVSGTTLHGFNDLIWRTINATAGFTLMLLFSAKLWAIAMLGVFSVTAGVTLLGSCRTYKRT